MADNKLNVTNGQPWELEINRAGAATLATAARYLDRDIKINVPAGAQNVSANSVVKSSVGSVATTAISGDITNIASTTAPASGDYYTITATPSITDASATLGVTASIDTTTAGFIAVGNQAIAEKTFETGTIKGTAGSAVNYYLPVATIGNDALSYTTAITGVDPDNGDVKDEITVSIAIPAGYYEATTLTKKFTDIIPDISADATASYILEGNKAYDDAGRVIVGTMHNFGAISTALAANSSVEGFSKEMQVSVAESATDLAATSAVISATNSASGIAIKSTGTVTPKVAIDQNGYFIKSEGTAAALAAAEETAYLTELTVAAGKTLASVTNNGTISELAGTGAIGEVSGAQTIAELSGTVSITAVDTGAKVIVEGTQVTDDATGALKIATVSDKNANGVIDGKIYVSEGWSDGKTPVSITNGAYEVDCALTVPQVSIDTVTGTTVQTAASGDYKVVVTPSQTKGSHTATATITKGGYIGEGSMSDTADIEASLPAASTVYLKTAIVAPFAASDTKQDNGIVPAKYQAGVSAGYVGADTTVADVTVYDGTFSWA